MFSAVDFREINRGAVQRHIPGNHSDNIKYRDEIDYAARRLKIQDKDKRLIPLVYKPAQLKFLRERTGRDLVLKSRQLGLTTVIQGDLYRETTTSTQSTLTLCHEDELTQKIRRMVDRFWNNDPARPDRKYANATVTTYPQNDSEATIVTVGGTAASKKGRGDTYSRIHGSEVAFWKDAESVIAGAIQGGNPKVALESTPNGAQGFFYELCMEALSGANDWTLHFFPWWIDPAYSDALDDGEALAYDDDELKLVVEHGLTPEQIKWRRRKRRELKHLFPQEYPEDPVACFLLSGLGYFGDVSHVFVASVQDGPIDGHRYAAGLDFGQSNDYTVLSVFDVTTLQQVALLRINRQKWGEMRRRVLQLCKDWRVTVLYAEGNSMGTTNIEELWSEAAELEINDLAINVFDTTNESKAQIMSALNESFQRRNGARLLDDANQKHEFQAFQASQTPSGLWKLSAPDKEHDDCVIAAALALHACVFGGSGGIHVPV
jgi:hypothetical protein